MSTPNPVPSPQQPTEGGTPFPQEDAATAERRPLWNPETAAPRWTDGASLPGLLYQALAGAGEGAAKGEQLLGGAWQAQYGLYAKIFDRVPGAGEYFRGMEQFSSSMQQDARDRVKALTPDAATTGAAASMVHGLASGLYRYSVGSLVGGPLAGAAVVGGSEGTSRFQELREQGMTPGAAGASAAVTGAFAGAGALLPAGFGTSLVGKILTGAGSNLGFGLVSRYADHKVLELAGYPEMAAQQDVWDKTAMATDLLLGGGFGAVAHAHGKFAEAQAAEQRLGRGVPGAEDAALTVNLALRDRSAGPGVPVDPGSAQASQNALESALTSVAQGKPVNVSDTGVQGATFAARPAEDRTPVQTLFIKALHDAGVLDQQHNLETLENALGARLRGEAPAEAEAQPVPAAAPRGTPWQIPRADEGTLSAGDREIETKFTQAMQGDYEGMKARYAQLADSVGGKVLNTDTARELSPDYLADRSRSAAVHEPASAFIKRLYAEKLAEAPGPGEDPVVLFTGGGTGAGKSTAIKNVLGAEAARAQIVFDTNMNGAKSAITKVDQALAAGKEVKIAYVHREPVEALEKGALKRAMRQEGEFGSGRTVPLDEHVATHVGANGAIRSIAEHYAGNPDVSMRVIDNTRGPGGARLIDLEELPRLDYNRTREEASAALEKAHAENRISERVYRGFGGVERPVAGEPGARAAGAESSDRGNAGAAGTADAGLGAGAGGQSEPQRAGGNPYQLGKVDPLADPAHQAVQENPQLQIPDDNGNLVNAAKTLSDAEQSTADAERESQKALMAAVNCFQRRGVAA